MVRRATRSNRRVHHAVRFNDDRRGNQLVCRENRSQITSNKSSRRRRRKITISRVRLCVTGMYDGIENRTPIKMTFRRKIL